MIRLGRVAGAVAAALLAVGTTTLVGAPPAVAQSRPDIIGAGSTWSQPAIDQWRNEVARQGINVNYQGVGSSAGRQFYIQDSVDFAVSEIPFYPEESTQLGGRRPFVYLPIVAGGTSLMYQLTDAANRPVTNLQLSARTTALIFTGRIRNWSDPAITADNNGRILKNQPITPVIRSDGSGTSAQFTAFLDTIVGDVWDPFMRERNQPPESTSFYPEIPNVTKAQSGSDGVANYVNANAGSIGYVERAFALQRNRPVASIRNASGAYTQPTADNVAVALTRARLNADRTQILNDVYVHPDPRAYPISSYSYMIAPTEGLDPEKGAVLADFVYYFACTGQRRADILGYSPLPPNLVETAFDAIREVPGAGPAPAIDAANCKNPTVTGERTSIGTSQGSQTVSNAPVATPSQVGAAPAPAGPQPATAPGSSGGGGQAPAAGAAGGGAGAGGGTGTGTGGGAAASGAGAPSPGAPNPGGTGPAAAPGAGSETPAGATQDAPAADPAATAADAAAPGVDTAAVGDASPTAVDDVAGTAAVGEGASTDQVAIPATVPVLSESDDDELTAPFALAALVAVGVVFLPPLTGMARRRRRRDPMRTGPAEADTFDDLAEPLHEDDDRVVVPVLDDPGAPTQAVDIAELGLDGDGHSTADGQGDLDGHGDAGEATSEVPVVRLDGPGDGAADGTTGGGNGRDPGAARSR